MLAGLLFVLLVFGPLLLAIAFAFREMGRHPRGLAVLFFTEMWERFGYYLMIGIFTLYMVDTLNEGLGFDKATAAQIYGTFIALVYLTPFAGGLIADQFLGYRKSVVLGGILMGIGYIGIGFFPGMAGFYTALALVALGNGFFKPSMSTLVGRLYPEGSPLKDSGYSIFYMGINIGAFLCNFVAAILRNQFGWSYAFAAAGVGMFLGVGLFLSGQKWLRGASDRGDGSAAQQGALLNLTVQVLLPAAIAGYLGYRFLGPYLGGAQTAAFVAATIPVVLYYLVLWAMAPREEKGPIGAILAMAGVVVIFWMVFHQNGSSLTYWAEENTRREAGALAPTLRALYMDQDATIGETIADPDAAGSYWRNVPLPDRPAPGEKATLFSTEIFQSVNPWFVVVLTPLVVGLLGRLRTRGREPSTPGKIAWGMMITAASTLFMIAAVLTTTGGTFKASATWLIASYGVITVGELFLSPMGLALVSKLSPARVTALMMGGWFLATAIGNKLAGVLAGFWEKIPLLWIFGINCLAALAAAAAIGVMTPWIKRIMAEHAGRATAGSAAQKESP
jgi:POT family proton-dependent oligopeptide transporter